MPKYNPAFDYGALLAMRDMAEKLNLHGAAVITLFRNSDVTPGVAKFLVIKNKFIDTPEETKAWSATGANYLAIAMSKIAEMAETKMDSGTSDQSPRSGEFGYKGGVIVDLGKDHIILLAFSGGTEEEDVQVAQEGKKALEEALSLLTDEVLRQLKLKEKPVSFDSLSDDLGISNQLSNWYLMVVLDNLLKQGIVDFQSVDSANIGWIFKKK